MGVGGVDLHPKQLEKDGFWLKEGCCTVGTRRGDWAYCSNVPLRVTTKNAKK